ncbi:MAG TPA: hypothetical protein VFQ31_03050, partial [Methyloceanibacter sp.]|nr:hypothetical protein [Methyloceanibacter sp.]
HRRLHALLAARRDDLGGVLHVLDGAGRILSLIVDGVRAPSFSSYMAVELIGGTLGLLVLAREQRKAEARAPL